MSRLHPISAVLLFLISATSAGACHHPAAAHTPAPTNPSAASDPGRDPIVVLAADSHKERRDAERPDPEGDEHEDDEKEDGEEHDDEEGDGARSGQDLPVDPRREGIAKEAPPTPWEAECGTCHIAFPPGLLPASSWKRVMDELDHHFGSDASIDDPTAREAVRAYLLGRAAGEAKFPPGPDGKPILRLTQARPFVREHHEVSARAWTSRAVKSAANCGACHLGATKGRFDEDEIRIPKP